MKFQEWNCLVQYSNYKVNNQKAIRLVDAEDGCPIATASVCIDYDFNNNETAIKNWSENEGMLEALVKNSVVKDTGKRVPCGFTEAAIVEILYPDTVDPAEYRGSDYGQD